MKVLILGGTKFTGPHICKHLLEAGHDVTVFHRSASNELNGVEHVYGDLKELPKYRDQLRRLKPDIVLHMMAYSETDANQFVVTFAGYCGRAVVISSADVYLVYGRIQGTEPGPAIPMPLREDAPLRQKLSLQGEGYNKTGVERIVASCDQLHTTIIRYPGVYGPNDPQHRVNDFLKRMEYGLPGLVFRNHVAGARMTYGYCEDVAVGVALAVMNDRAAGKIYNIGEKVTPTWSERGNQIGLAAGWDGKVVSPPDDLIPKHVFDISYSAPDWVLDTTLIREELGYTEVVSEEVAWRRTVAWERQNPILPTPEEIAEYELEREAIVLFNKIK